MKCPIELAFVQIAFGDFAEIDTAKTEPKRRRMPLANTEKAMAYTINGKNGTAVSSMGHVLPNGRPERSITMKKRLFVVAVVLAIIFVALPVMSILAGDIFHFSGKGADAFFSSFDGCIFTDVGVFANDGRFQSPPGPGSSSSGAFIFINQLPHPVACPFVSPLFFSGFASLPDPDFRVNEGLTSARLKTTITVFDSFGSAVDANIDLTWTGTGDITREMNNFHFQSPGIIVNGHFRGSSRPAQASGSVSIGATNFTPAPSVFGQIISSRSGQVTIQ